ncbi:lysostaphin resistance A-like protein [Bacteroidota bacterium]
MKNFKFIDHPQITLWVILISIVVSIVISEIFLGGMLGLSGNDPYSNFLRSLSAHLILVFLIIPFLLGLPKGNRNFKTYLDDIRLTNTGQFTRLLLIALSSYLILVLCQSLGSIVYRFLEGEPVNLNFIISVINIKGDLPPESLSLLTSLPSAFEELVFRGVLLTFFLLIYSKRKAIIFSSFGFSIIHLLNLVSGRDPVWVAGQLVWTFLLGIFYGYLFIQTGSLLPNMLFHYISNAFVGTFNYYINSTASVEIQALYGIIFTFGILPVFLMIIWIKYFTSRWPFTNRIK